MIYKTFFLLVALVFSFNLSAAQMRYDNGFVIHSDDDRFSLRTNLLFQGQYIYVAAKDTVDTSTFQIRRSSTQFSGHAYTRDLMYEIELETPASSGGASPTLLDAFAHFIHRPDMQFKFGQYEVPFDRETLTWKGRLQFVEGSVARTYFSMGRDIGINFKSQFQYDRAHADIFLVNGDGANAANANKAMVFGGRFMYDLFDPTGYTTSDLHRSMRQKLSLAVAAAYDFGNATLAGNKLIRMTADAAYRYRGISAAAALHFVRNTDNSENDFGFMGQGGYFFDKDLEAVGRYAAVLVNTTAALSTGLESQHEFTAGVNYYVYEEAVKLQSDYSLLINAAGVDGQTDHRLRVQVQVAI